MASRRQDWAFKVTLSHVRVTNLGAAIDARGGKPNDPPDALQVFPEGKHELAVAEAAKKLLPCVRCVLRFAFDGRVQDFPLIPDAATNIGSTHGSSERDLRPDATNGIRDATRGETCSAPADSTDVVASDFTIDQTSSAFVYRIQSESMEQLTGTLSKRFATLQVLLLTPSVQAPRPSPSQHPSGAVPTTADGDILAVLGSATASLYELLVAQNNPSHRYSFGLSEETSCRSRVKASPHSQDHAKMQGEGVTASVHSSDFDDAEKSQMQSSSVSDDDDGGEFMRAGDGIDAPGRRDAVRRPSRVSAVITMREVRHVEIRFSTLIASHVALALTGAKGRNDQHSDLHDEGPCISPLRYKLRYHLVTQRPSASYHDRDLHTTKGGGSAEEGHWNRSSLHHEGQATPLSRQLPITAAETPLQLLEKGNASTHTGNPSVGDTAFLPTDRVVSSEAVESPVVCVNEDGNIVFKADRDLPSLTVKATRDGLAQQRVLFSLWRVASSGDADGRDEGALSSSGHGLGRAREVLQCQYEVPLAEALRMAKGEQETYPFTVRSNDTLQTLNSITASVLESSLEGVVKLYGIPCLLLSTPHGDMSPPGSNPVGKTTCAAPVVQQPQSQHHPRLTATTGDTDVVVEEEPPADDTVVRQGEKAPQQLGERQPSATASQEASKRACVISVPESASSSPNFSPQMPLTPPPPPDINLQEESSTHSISLFGRVASPLALSPAQQQRHGGKKPSAFASDSTDDHPTTGAAAQVTGETADLPMSLRTESGSGDNTLLKPSSTASPKSSGTRGNHRQQSPTPEDDDPSPTPAAAESDRLPPSLYGKATTAVPKSQGEADQAASAQPSAAAARQASLTSRPPPVPMSAHTESVLPGRSNSGRPEEAAAPPHGRRRSSSTDTAAREAAQAMRLHFTSEASQSRHSPDPTRAAGSGSRQSSASPALDTPHAVLGRIQSPSPTAPDESTATAAEQPLCPLWYDASVGARFRGGGPSEADKRTDGELVAVYRNLLSAYEAQAERARIAQDNAERLGADMAEQSVALGILSLSATGGERENRRDPSPRDGTTTSLHDAVAVTEGSGGAMEHLQRMERQLFDEIAATQDRLCEIRANMAQNTESYKAAKQRLEVESQYITEGITALSEAESDLEALLSDAEAQLRQTEESKARASEDTRRVQAQLAEREHTFAMLENQLRGSLLRHNELRAVVATASASGTTAPPSTSNQLLARSTAEAANAEEAAQVSDGLRQEARLTPSPPEAHGLEKDGGRPDSSSPRRSPQVARRLSMTALPPENRRPATAGGYTDVSGSKDWRYFIDSSVAGKAFAAVQPHPYASESPHGDLASNARVIPLRGAFQLQGASERRPATATSAAAEGVAPRVHSRGAGVSTFQLPTAGQELRTTRQPTWDRTPPATASFLASRASGGVGGSTATSSQRASVAVMATTTNGETLGFSDTGFVNDGEHKPHTPSTPRPTSAHYQSSPSASSRRQTDAVGGGTSPQQQPEGTPPPLPRRPQLYGAEVRVDAEEPVNPALCEVEVEALLEAIEQGDVDVACHLLHTKPYLVKHNNSLLHAACATPCGASSIIVETLMRLRPEFVRGLDVLSGNTALHFACGSSRPCIPVIRALLLAGVPTDVRNMEGYTAFHVALLNKADQPLHKVKDTLLALSPREHAVNVNERTTRGQTPLHLICGSDGNAALVRYLLARGADVWARSPFVNPLSGGRVHEVTPMEQSRETGAMVVCQMIEKAALDINVGVF